MHATRLDPLLRYWRAQDALFAREETHWWGAVISDARYPHVQEPNYARVETAQPVGLAEIEEALVPAMRASGSARAHVVVFHPEQQTVLVVEASTRGDPVVWDLVMEHAGTGGADAPEGATPAGAPDRTAEEVSAFDDAFWAAHRASLRWFDVVDAVVLDEIAAIERDVLLPVGRRWFAVRGDGAIVSLAALLVLEGVGYVDHVVTLPDFRRRGFARAVVRRAVQAATASGAERTYLLADRDAPAVELYRALGFGPVASFASWIHPIDGAASGATSRAWR